MKEEIQIVPKSAPIDFQLADLLGEKPGDFIILMADGVQLDWVGTPPDSPGQRVEYTDLVDALNAPFSKEWIQFFTDCKARFCRQFELPPQTTFRDFQPRFSVRVSRVCGGYSQYLYVACRLFESQAKRLSRWELSMDEGGKHHVMLANECGDTFCESGDVSPMVIARAFVRLLGGVPVEGGGE